MRWLALVVLGACSFSPGRLAGDAGQAGDDVRVDGPGSNEVDALDATPPSPARVRSIEIADAKVIGGPHADFPLLVSITAVWLKSVDNAGDVARADGFDIWFATDPAGATVLAHEVESYDPVAGSLVAWVKIPSLTAQTVVYLHYGDPVNMTNPEQATSVWTGGYELVVHMDGTGDATGKSTTNQGVNLGPVAGRIGPARSFDGSTSFLNSGADAAVDNIFTGGGTVEAWFFATGFGEGSRGRIFDKGEWILFVDNSNVSSSITFTHDGATLGAWAAPASSVTLNAWHHVAITYDKASSVNDPVIVLDGAAVALTLISIPTGVMNDDDIYNVLIGDTGGGGRAYAGTLDELRLSSAPRGTGWVQTQYQNHLDPSAFYTVSAPL